MVHHGERELHVQRVCVSCLERQQLLLPRLAGWLAGWPGERARARGRESKGGPVAAKAATAAAADAEYYCVLLHPGKKTMKGEAVRPPPPRSSLLLHVRSPRGLRRAHRGHTHTTTGWRERERRRSQPRSLKAEHTEREALLLNVTSFSLFKSSPP